MKWLLSSNLSQFTLCFKAIKQHAAHFYPMTDTSTNSLFYRSKNYNSWQRTFFCSYVFNCYHSQLPLLRCNVQISEYLFMISQTPILNDTLWKRVGARATWYPPPLYESKFSCIIWCPDYFAYSALLLLPLVLDSCCQGSHSRVNNITLQSQNPICPEKRVVTFLGPHGQFHY